MVAFCFTAPTVEEVARATSSRLSSSTFSMVNTSCWLSGKEATRSSNEGRSVFTSFFWLGGSGSTSAALAATTRAPDHSAELWLLWDRPKCRYAGILPWNSLSVRAYLWPDRPVSKARALSTWPPIIPLARLQGRNTRSRPLALPTCLWISPPACRLNGAPPQVVSTATATAQSKSSRRSQIPNPDGRFRTRSNCCESMNEGRRRAVTVDHSVDVQQAANIFWWLAPEKLNFARRRATHHRKFAGFGCGLPVPSGKHQWMFHRDRKSARSGKRSGRYRAGRM